MRHIPNGYQLIAKDERFGFEVHGIESPVIAIAFCGKALKPAWHFRFTSIENRDQEIAKTLAGLMDNKERKEKRASEKKIANASHDVKPGDVFRCSWGYDQTNIDFYQVMSVSGQMMTVCEIGQMREETMFMQGECVPALDRFIGKPRRVKIQKFSLESEPYFSVNSFSTAFRIKPAAKIGDKAVFESSHWTAYA